MRFLEACGNVGFPPIADTNSRGHETGMSGAVWISRAMKHATNQRPITSEITENDIHRSIEISTLNQLGVPLDSSHFPDKVFGARHSLERHYQLPDLFRAGSFWVVSDAAADVLRQFDLGQGALYPVRVLKKDRATPIRNGWFCINFGNARPLVDVEQSPVLRPGAQGRYLFSPTLADDQLVVSAEALHRRADRLPPASNESSSATMIGCSRAV